MPAADSGCPGRTECPVKRMMYLDNAATSFPKPECVLHAVTGWMTSNGAAYGRGGHDAAAASQRLVEECRSQTARLLGVAAPQQVAFTFNCTDSLNLLLRGLLQSGDRVVTTRMEHNSVLRPLTQLQQELQLDLELAGFAPTTGLVDVDAVRRLLQQRTTRLLVVSHASNVTGCIQPVAELARLAHESGALVLLDAAQTAGHIPCSMQQLEVDFLAAAGHKGLLGPLGTGVLAIRPGLESLVRPIRCGGTGSASESLQQPETMPARFESGNLNMPGLAGLHAATRWLLQESVETVRQRVQELTERLRAGLRTLPQVTIYADQGTAPRTGLVTFNIGDVDSRDVAAILDQSFQIQCRAGLHCAPLTHAVLGTSARGGAVRFSPGHWTTESEIDAALQAVAEIAAAFS